MTVFSDYRAILSDFSWNGVHGEAGGATPVFLTYSFADDEPAYAGQSIQYEQGSFESLSSSERALFRAALDAWSAVAGISFFEVGQGRGDIEVGAYDIEAAGLGGYPDAAFYRGEDGTETLFGGPEVPGAGKIYLDVDYSDDPHVMLHEIGHALGLKHPHEDENILEPGLDKGDVTVMSYESPRAVELGPLDVEAVRFLYGDASVKGGQVADWSFDESAQTLRQTGTNGDDRILGTGTHDVVEALNGQDLIVTRGGNDTISLGGRGFQVNGGSGFDVVAVAFASDTINEIYTSEGDNGIAWLKSGDGFDAHETGTLLEIERVAFTDRTFALDTAEGERAGEAYRMYQAAFDRTPDDEGLTFWIEALDAGVSLNTAAQGFVASPEFLSVYGVDPSNRTFVDRLYQNILQRSGEADGIGFWTDILDSGSADKADVLEGFSESPENVALLAPVLDEGIFYG